MLLDDLMMKFKTYFNEENSHPMRTFFAPGRVNLIGEHIDYNGGYVFPASLSIGTYLIAQQREDNNLVFISENFQGKIYQRTIENLYYNETDNWSNYPKGVLDYFKQEFGVKLTGLNLFYCGNIPNGSGLSSSASIELVTATMVNELFQVKLSPVELVKLSQKVENNYIGVNCGIMDQFAIGMGKKEHAVILDCATLDYDYVPLDLAGHKIVIMNSNKKRKLADSKYNERRGECELAVKELQSYREIKNLCDLDYQEFLECEALLSSDIIKRRVRHVVSENDRTKEAVACLKAGDLEHFGKLLNASHASLKEDYEVTGIELDTLAESAQKQPGCLGARMTGAGFGGCALAIVKDEAVASFIENVSKEYEMVTDIEASFYVVETGNGACEIQGGAQ